MKDTLLHFKLNFNFTEFSIRTYFQKAWEFAQIILTSLSSCSLF